MEVEEPGESFAYSEANGRPRYVPPSESGLPDDDASIAFSDAGLSDKPPAAKPRSAAPSISGSVRAGGSRKPSHTGGANGGGGGLASEKNFSMADDDASIAFSDAGLSDKPASAKPRAPSQRATSTSGSAKGGPSAPAAAAAASSIAGDDYDPSASIAFSDAGLSDKPASAKPRAPSQRATSTSGSAKGGPSAPAAAAASSIAGDEYDPSASIAFSDAGLSDKPPAKRAPSTASSRKPSEAGGAAAKGAGASKPARNSGVSGSISGFTVDHDEGEDDDDGAASSVAAPPKRRSSGVSLASSAKPTPAAAAAKPKPKPKPAESGSIDLDGDVDLAATVSLSQSQFGDDAASARSGAAAAAAAKRRSSAAGGGRAPSESGLSVRSSRTAAPAPASAAAKSTSSIGGGYSEAVASEGEGSDADAKPRRAAPAPAGSDHEDAAEQSDGDAKRVSMSMSGRVSLVASASQSTLGGAPRPRSRAGERPPSASGSRRSAAPTASGGGYSDDFDDAATSRKSSRVSRPAASAAASGSIFQEDVPDASVSSMGASGKGGSGGPVFKRVPANAPDSPASASVTSSPAAPAAKPRPSSSRASSRAESRPAAPASASGADSFDGAIRVPPPGAPRPNSGRRQPPPADDYDDVGSSGGGRNVYSRQRPASAAPRDRQGAQVEALVRKHPATWDALDVALWVEFIGLGQYRRRFLHHCVDGRMLLRLKDAQLKSELGIGPMGHRLAVLEAAAQLVRNYEEAAAAREAGSEDGDGEGGRHEYGGRGGSAPRHRPASALPGGAGALTAPPPPPGGPRRPASASRSVIPPDPYLGPALGKQTVYEQRARLLFELDRAQARAEQHRALAEQLKYTAGLSSDEVAHLRGLLTDIEAKNRAAFGTAGGAVDSSARIPWRHVGPGTRHNNWASERFARPGDPETVDMTFQPRISKESKKIMGGGGEYGEGSGGANNFLDRLNNDLRKRQTNRKELERRYYSEGAAAGSAAQAEADWQVVAEGLQSRCHVQLDREDTAGTDDLIDEAVDKLSTGESWREAGCRAGPIRGSKGGAKVAAMAQALRSLAFMERYKSDLKQKNGKMKALETKWLHQTLGAQYLPGAKDKDDLAQAVGFFALLGWRGHDGGPSEEAVTEDLLDRLLDRAMEYRVRYDVWWDRVRERPEERAAGFVCDVDWRGESRWAADGLGSLMDREMDRHQRGVDNDAASGQPDSPGQMDFVDFTVQLLGKSRLDDLRRLRGSSAGSGEGGGLSERGKRLAVYRAIRTQKFIEFTQKDLEERERKLRQAYTALAPPKRVLQSSRIEGFFERLMEDASKRRAKADKLAHDKVAKEKEILASSVMYGRPRSAR
ncbi:hypothetical protein HXX76_015522 [Chlamydomonas incerta]|uniref:SAM domain-containing protein n=1 Tax=Chlamydomonas incerta TaxID=51695 RepID=A0A835SEA2_CHLIN|nr:hypothetical protein HXX76_015522 [Chlamydomonas incerta]|eukprot:KAG2423137.1 hypothetical protein HXX76_015522 [Chlamydomonas incerta]